jgi:hypothetical protein
LKIADRSSRAPTFQKIGRRQDGEHEVNCCGGNQKKDAVKTTSFVFVVVLSFFFPLIGLGDAVLEG